MTMLWTFLLLLLLINKDCCGKQTLKKILNKNNDQETLIVTTTPLRKSGITKRAILIGSKVCGKGGLVDKTPLKIAKRDEEIDFEALHRDLHPELLNQTKTIPATEPGQTHVVSKVSQKPQWFERLDRCCVDHEECNKFIPAKQERYNYKNDREYTIYDCKCDDSFAECLKYADSYTADAVGDLYFNVLKMPCINFPEDASENTPTESQNIVDKVNEILAKKPGKQAVKDTKSIAESIEELKNKATGNQRSVTLESLDEHAKEREAKHFKRNGHA